MEPNSFSNPRFIATNGMIALTIASIVIGVVGALYFYRPPGVVGEGAVPIVFSAGRAFVHVEEIAKRPHPWGSPDQLRVMDYIREYVRRFNLEPFEADPPPRAFSPAGPPIRNIAVRIPGKESTGAVLFMAHHDSKRGAPGAGDDASGVAALLETIRAIDAGEPLQNDLIFLFTDAEEATLGGAKAFIHGNEWDESDEGHPWKKDVKLVLNFDGRGAAGPVMVTDTGDNNGWVVRQLAEGAPYLIANSLMRDVTRRMPNASDIDPFFEAGFPILNFNFADDYPRYHSPLDVPAGFDKRTLQHMGEYALSLAKHLGEADLTEVTAPNRTYFNVVAHVFAHYPAWLTWPLYIIAVAVFIAAVVVGIRFGVVSIPFSLLALLALLLIGAAVTGAVYALSFAIEYVQPDTLKFTFHYQLALACTVAILVFTPLFAIARVWIRAQDLMVAGMFIWIVAAGAVTIVAPGGSGLFVWPAYIALFGLIVHFVSDDFEQAGTSASLCWAVLAISLASLFTGNIIALNLAAIPSGTYLLTISTGFLLLLFCLLIPHLSILLDRRPWITPVTMLLLANIIAVTMLVIAEPRARFAAAQALEHSERYALDTVEKPKESLPMSEADLRVVRSALARGERHEALETVYPLPPRDAFEIIRSLARENYDELRDIDAYAFLAQQAIDLALVEADRDEENREQWLSDAKEMAYNLGADLWPGWGTPGITINEEHLQAGSIAAAANLRLARELDRPADKVAMAQWLVGAQALAANRIEAATQAFDQAATIQAESEDNGAAQMYRAYSLLAKSVADETSRAAFDEAVDALAQSGEENAVFYADQLRTAARVFLSAPSEQ